MQSHTFFLPSISDILPTPCTHSVQVTLKSYTCGQKKKVTLPSSARLWADMAQSVCPLCCAAHSQRIREPPSFTHNYWHHLLNSMLVLKEKKSWNNTYKIELPEKISLWVNGERWWVEFSLTNYSHGAFGCDGACPLQSLQITGFYELCSLMHWNYLSDYCPFTFSFLKWGKVWKKNVCHVWMVIENLTKPIDCKPKDYTSDTSWLLHF